MNLPDSNSPPLSLLVVEDDESLRESLIANLEAEGFHVQGMESGQEGLKAVAQDDFSLILTDLRLPDMDGLQFIDLCLEEKPDASIILMTAFGSIDLALEAIRHGAYDYISKPFTPEQLILVMRKFQERQRLQEENEELRSTIRKQYRFSNIIARSESMREVFETVKRLSSFNTTVLITGESGTGKELLAKAIHHNSPRKGRPFVAINCSAIPENLMESELFGHKKGSFTDATRDKQGLFEEASGGTLFLDEIGEMPLHLQVKLLRSLQERTIRPVGDEEIIPIDVRVIAATLRNLEEDALAGRFRDDLFYRLNVVSMHLPPLRERAEDIPVLVDHFLEKHSKRLGLDIEKIDPEAMKCLMNYRWRGNVRELENCIERAMVLTETKTVTRDSLPPHIAEVFGGDGASSGGRVETIEHDNLSIKQRSKALEIDLILRALEKTDGNRTHAAKLLEISHRALLYKIKEYGLSEVGKQ